MLISAISVGVGGAIGAVARFLMTSLALSLFGAQLVPAATLLINVLGSFGIGLLAGFGERFEGFPLELRLLLTTGVLGGFTTFSAFSMETMAFLRQGEIRTAVFYVAGTLGFGILAVFVGFFVGRS